MGLWSEQPRKARGIVWRCGETGSVSENTGKSHEKRFDKVFQCLRAPRILTLNVFINDFDKARQCFCATRLKHWSALCNRAPRNAHRARICRAKDADSRHAELLCLYAVPDSRADCRRLSRDKCARDVHCAARGYIGRSSVSVASRKNTDEPCQRC